MRRQLALLVLAIVVAGCGSTAPPQPLKSTRIKCSSQDATMNCVLLTLPGPPRSVSAKRGQPRGVDFGWGSVTPVQAHAWHLAFVASYLSNDPSKNFTAAAVRAFHAEGVKTVDVWESTADRATQGRAAGEQDARAAKAQAAQLGNTTRPILFAVDCDCTDAQILPYFQGVDSVLPPSRVGAYGGYSQVLFLHSQAVVGDENWQTYAWSDGKWLPGSIAPLEQYLNGSTVDWDRAIAIPYAQFPWSPPKPPKPPKPPVHTTTTPPPPPPPPPAHHHRVCFGRGVRDTGFCKAVQLRWAWLVARRNLWQRQFDRCIKYTDWPRCGLEWHWYRVRGYQAMVLKRRYS